MKKFFYRVQKGETIMSVAEKLKVPQMLLIEQNNLVKEIEAGDLLYCEQIEAYSVKAEDTIESVSKKFNVSPQELLEKNSLPYIFYGLNIKV